MMVFGLFRRNPRVVVIEPLYQRIAVSSREPFLYLALGVPDTVEGRFEAVTLHMTLVLRRLRELPPPADQVAQDLVDCFFRNLDAYLRELAVGDLGVPRRMKTLAEAFNGRSRAYDEALNADAGDLLARTLARNVLGRAEPAHELASYVRRSAVKLADSTLDDFLGEGPRFAGPGSSQGEERP